MSEQPTADARPTPSSGGKKILGVPRTTFYLLVAGAVVVGLAFYWWKNYQSAQQASTASTASGTDTGNVDTSGQLSTIQTELETLLEEEGATTTTSTSGSGGSSGGGTGWGNGGGWSGGTSGSGSGSSGSSSSGSSGSTSSGSGSASVNGNGSAPVTSTGSTSTGSTSSSTTAAAPKTSPPNIAGKANGSQIVITWGAVGGATGYQIQVAEPGGNLILNKNLTATSATISPAPMRGTYDFKIRALNQNTPGPWSAVKQVTVLT